MGCIASHLPTLDCAHSSQTSCHCHTQQQICHAGRSLSMLPQPGAGQALHMEGLDTGQPSAEHVSVLLGEFFVQLLKWMLLWVHVPFSWGCTACVQPARLWPPRPRVTLLVRYLSKWKSCSDLWRPVTERKFGGQERKYFQDVPIWSCPEEVLEGMHSS